MNQIILRGGLAIVVFVFALSSAFAEGPAPCGAVTYPPSPALDAPANFRIWTSDELGSKWTPPACTGWQPNGADHVVAVAGIFKSDGDADAMLKKIGAISAWAQTRYWSLSGEKWNVLFAGAKAVSATNVARADYSLDEIKNGTALLFAPAEGPFKGTLRFRIKEQSATRIVFELATDKSALLQSVYFLDRRANGWSFYSLTRMSTDGVASVFYTPPNGSYVNRVVAIYRYVAGIASNREPPACSNANKDCKANF